MSLTEEQIARYARQILVKQVGGAGQEKLCAARAQLAARGRAADVARMYLEAGGTKVTDDGEALCTQCEGELFGAAHPVEAGALAALAFQQRVLSGRCPRHP